MKKFYQILFCLLFLLSFTKGFWNDLNVDKKTITDSISKDIRDKVITREKGSINLKKDYKKKEPEEDFEMIESLDSKMDKRNLIAIKENLIMESEPNENLEIKIINIKLPSPMVIGVIGEVYFFTNYNNSEKQIFNPNDIEEKTSFISNFIDDKNFTHNITCRFFSPTNENIRIFCHVNENGEDFGENIKSFNNCSFIYENNYKINIFSEDLNLMIRKIDYPIPFVYSDKQILYTNMNDKEQKSSLKFKFDAYYNETLIIYGETHEYILLNDCRIELKEIICDIKQEILNNMLVKNNDNLYIMYYTDFFIVSSFINVLDIKVNIVDYRKQNIYVKITKLLDNISTESNNIAYETNVTNISNIKSTDFYLFDDIKSNDVRCYFKKYSQTPLLLLCDYYRWGNFSLGEIEREIILDKISAKYNFIILPVINYEQFEIENRGTNIFFATIDIFNFTTNDEINLTYIKGSPIVLKNIRMNPYSNDLELNKKNDMQVYSTIHKSHFENQISGYFFTYYLNSIRLGKLKKYSIYYEFSPIQVILPFDNKIFLRIKKENNLNIIKIGKNGILYFTTNYNDYQRNIFDINDIKEISFKSSIIDEYKNEYKVDCRLWKPINERVRIFCDLEDTLKYPIQNITIEQVSFNYNDYIINIIQEEYLEVEQFNYEISFLYSDQYIIYLYDENEFYNLRFNIKTYYNDILFLYGQANNYAVLDNCEINNKELNCKITKTKFEEILALNKEIFKIGIMNDNIGIIPSDCILDIIVYNENIKKKILLFL